MTIKSTTIPWNPEAPVRDRRHQQLVAMVLNSLIFQGILEQQGMAWVINTSSTTATGGGGGGGGAAKFIEGQRWYAGPTPPSPRLGKEGDFYLGDTGEIYQKVSPYFGFPPSWVLKAMAIRGPKGPMGDRGPAAVGGIGGGTGGGGGTVSQVTNSDGTLTISPTTGAIVASLNQGHANTWTALQTLTAGITSIPAGSGTQNERYGAQTMTVSVSGSDNVALGYHALSSLTSGNENAAIGSLALSSNDIGSGNLAIGHNSLGQNTSGDQNVAIGQSALSSNISGSNNVAIGQNALTVASGQDNNVAVGQGVMQAVVSGAKNTGVGTSALGSLTGSFATAVGAFAGYSNTNTGGTYLGYAAGYASTGAGNVLVGYLAGYPTLSSGTNNTFVGYSADAQSGGVNYGTALGYQAQAGTNELALSPYTTFQTFYTLSSSSTLRQTHDITIVQVDNTDATRKYRFVLNAWDTAAREVMRGEASGAAAALSFFGGTANIKQAVTGKIASATTVADLVTTLTSLMTALATKYNLVTDSTT